MNRNFKGILYTIITVFIIILVVRFLLGALPYLIIAGLIIWLLFKFKNRNKRKEEDDYRSDETYYKSQSYESTNESQGQSEDEDFDTSNAIDVEFEDINDK